MAKTDQTLVYSGPYTDDMIDFRQMLGKDTDKRGAEIFDSPYVLFVPGFPGAPKRLRAAGRTEITVSAELAEELRTHPRWRFLLPDDATARNDAAKKAAADYFGADLPATDAAVPAGDPPVSEIAQQTPSDPKAVIQSVKAEQEAQKAESAEKGADGKAAKS